ncbi:MAG: hypothetical protein ACW99U_19140, partial [Candidatus Thorarchaeota archaeon]
MKSTLLNMLRILLILLIVVPGPSSVIAQNIEWGVETDESFTYVLQKKYVNDYGEEDPDVFLYFGFLSKILLLEQGKKYNLDIEKLPQSFDQMTNVSSFPLSHCSLISDNDGSVIVENDSFFVVPLGIWNVSSNSQEAYMAKVTNVDSWLGEIVSLIDTDEVWGISCEFWYGLKPTWVGAFELLYEKENGTLSSLKLYHEFRAGPPPGRVVYDWLLVLWHPGMPTIIVDNGFQVVLLG